MYVCVCVHSIKLCVCVYLRYINFFGRLIGTRLLPVCTLMPIFADSAKVSDINA